MAKRAWIFWESVAPARPAWLHMLICPFCRGWLLGRREWLRSLGERAEASRG